MLTIFKQGTISILVIGLAVAGFAGMSYAAYPEKPVTIIVAYGAGGSADTCTRTYAPFISKYLGVPVVVKNMPGAGGMIGTRYVSKQAPDGYTLFNLTLPSYVTRALFKKATDYDLRKFSNIYGIAGGDSNGLMVPFNSRFTTFKELLEAAKKEPITFSATSPGSNSWLLSQYLEQETGLTYNAVTFDSGRKATMAVVGGHVTGGIASTVNFPDLVREKKIRVLGVGSTKRLPYLPDVPTFAELGYPRVKSVNRQLLSAPPGLPDDVQKILVDATAKAAADPEFLTLAKKTGFIVAPLTQQEAQQEVVDTYDQITKLLTAIGKK